MAGASVSLLDESTAGRPFATEIIPVGEAAMIFAAGSAVEIREWIEAFKAAAAPPAGVIPPAPPVGKKLSPSKAIEVGDDKSHPVIVTIPEGTVLASPKVQTVNAIFFPEKIAEDLIPVASTFEEASRSNSMSPLEKSPSSAFMMRGNVFLRSPSGTPLNVSTAKDSPVDVLTKGISNDSIDETKEDEDKESTSPSTQNQAISAANQSEDKDVKPAAVAVGSSNETNNSATPKKFGAASKKGLSKLFSAAVGKRLSVMDSVFVPSVFIIPCADENELKSKLMSQLKHQGEDPSVQLTRQFSSGDNLGRDGKFWTESAASDLQKHKISRRKLIYECRSLRQKVGLLKLTSVSRVFDLLTLTDCCF